MSKMHFQSSPHPTLGVELEMALVDEKTMALSSSIERVLGRIPEDSAVSIKPELMQCYLEINTKICRNANEAATDLRQKIATVEHICDELDLRLYWTATHPFSRWQDQKPTPDERYAKLLNILQDVGRQLVTFGLHVHVGVDSGDKAVMICDRIMRYLPALLAVSGNSPWWNNRVSGLQSHRSKILEGLPTAGLPSLMRNWSEYVWLVNHLIETGFINSIRDIWWDVRPHHNFGTVEVRVCDMPGNLDSALAIASLVHCLVYALSEDIDQGAYQHDCHPMLVRQNKWRAARYGLDAELIDSVTHQKIPARLVLTNLVERLRDTAQQLRCEAKLEEFLALIADQTWADRQLATLKKTGDASQVVRRMTELSRVS